MYAMCRASLENARTHAAKMNMRVRWRRRGMDGHRQTDRQITHAHAHTCKLSGDIILLCMPNTIWKTKQVTGIAMRCTWNIIKHKSRPQRFYAIVLRTFVLRDRNFLYMYVHIVSGRQTQACTNTNSKRTH